MHKLLTQDSTAFGRQKIMAGTGSESEMRPVEVITEYKWSLHKWSLLYLQYNDIGSPKIRIRGVDGCTCRINLVIFSNYSVTSFVVIEFSDITQILSVAARISLLDNRGQTLWAETSHINDRKIRQHFPVKLERTGMDKYLKNDTLVIHVALTIVKSILISTCLKDVYSVNFEEIVRENVEALQIFHQCREVTLFIGGKKLFADKIICADKTELFKAILMGVVSETGEYGTYLSDRKVKMFQEFLDYLDDKPSSRMAIDKIVNVKRYTLDERKWFVRQGIAVHLPVPKKVTPADILEYLLTTYNLLCEVLRHEAHNFIKLHDLNISIPENDELFFKYLSLVKDFDE